MKKLPPSALPSTLSKRLGVTTKDDSYPSLRMRLNRRSEAARALARESLLETSDLVMPLFVMEGVKKRVPVLSMPGIDRLSIDLALKECEKLLKLGIRGVAPFPVIPEKLKDKHASESINPNGLYAKTIRTLKKEIPNLVIFADVAMDPYSCDGHDGLVDFKGNILNDETLPILAEQALLEAQCGADFVAPSDMMDGRIGFIRKKLDEAGFKDTGILSYAAKYASSFYGPFRDALGSAPKKGDKKTYQMDPANIKEALLEVELDIQEGADIVMVKPGLPYLDVIHAVSQKFSIPIAAYNVSGEYAMIKAAAEKLFIDEKNTVLESLLAFKRAGASLIFTYHAKAAASWLRIQ